MRKFTSLLFALVFLAVLVVPASAAGPASYESDIHVTNVTSSTGHITLDYYNSSGSVVASYSDTLAAYETKWYVTLPGLSSSFDGSLVISSDVQLGSLSTVIGKDGGGTPISYAQYVGRPSGNSSVYLPLLMDSNYGFNTFFYVQNVSTSPVDVAITYSDGLVVSGISALQPGAAAKIDNNAEAHTAKKFSAILTATGGDITAAAVEWGDGTYGNPLMGYNDFLGGTTFPIVPMVNENNYGYWTAIPMQNLGGSTTTVTMSYTPTKSGSACTETMDIPAYGQVEFGSYAFVFSATAPYSNWSSNCAMGVKFVGIGEVTVNSASMPLVGLDNQTTTILPGSDKGATLDSVNPADATSTVVFPDVRQWAGTYDWWTSITITNLSGFSLPIDDVSCHAVGTDTGGPVDMTYTNSAVIADGAGWITDLYNGWGPLPNGFVGGMVCTSATGSIVGTGNTLGHNAPADMDSYVLYDGINQ